MKKWVSLLLATVLCFSLFGCAVKEEKEDKKESLQLQDRYVLYLQEGALQCLDSKTGKTTAIDAGMEFQQLTHAMIAQDGNAMLIDASYFEKAYLVHWDIQKNEATVLGEDTHLCRASDDMKSVVYLQGQDGQKLFRYTAGEGSQLLAEYTNRVFVSVTADCSHVLCEVMKDTQMSELYEITSSGETNKIADINFGSVDTTDDHSVVCYTKREEVAAQSFAPSWSAYQWTRASGEVKLPFLASAMCVYEEDKIYYVRNDGNDNMQQYYYDGETSHLLSERRGNHGHKMGKYLYCYHGDDGDYLAYGKEIVRLPGRICPRTAIYATLSEDEKTVGTWSNENGVYYHVTLSNGKFKIEEKEEIGKFGLRAFDIQENGMAYIKDGALYFNGAKIAEGVKKSAGVVLFADGEIMLYEKANALYRYSQEDDSCTKLCESEELGDFLPVWNESAVYTDGQTLYLHNGDKAQTIAENVTDMCDVTTWKDPDEGLVCGSFYRPGMWYDPNSTDLLFGRSG